MSKHWYEYRYTITLTKHQDGWEATCRVFPNLVVQAKGKNSAYKQMKWKIREQVMEKIHRGEHIPKDRSETQHFVLDIRPLQDETNLR